MEVEDTQSVGAEAGDAMSKDSGDAVLSEKQDDRTANGERDGVGVGDAGDAPAAAGDKLTDEEGHVAVEADYRPVGFVDSVVESGIEMEPSDGDSFLPLCLIFVCVSFFSWFMHGHFVVVAPFLSWTL